MATYYSQDSNTWSTLANWNTVRTGGGSSPASVADMDNDIFVIQAEHSISLDVDMSGFANGIAGLTIEGGETPGMLYSKYNAAGTYYLMIKTGTTLSGTTSTNRGRLLGNSDGVWGNTGSLPFDRKFIIDLKGTAYINASNLDTLLYDTEPAIKEVGTYRTKLAVTDVNTSTNVITLESNHGWTGNTPVKIKSSGTLPSPLIEDAIYFVGSPSGATLKLLYYSSAREVDLTDVGSGTIEIYSGHTSTSTGVMNVLTDVTADPQWANGTAVVLVDIASENFDQQRTTISSTTSGTITLAVNVDSVQWPGAKIFIVQRNIEIKNNGTSPGQSIINFGTSTFTGSVFQCSIRQTQGQVVGVTTFYGFGFYGGINHIIGGTISGCSVGTYGGINHIIGGTISGCNTGMNVGIGHIISGTISGCSTGISLGTNCTINGTISGCNAGIGPGTNCIINGTISGCSNGINVGINCIINGTISGCNAGLNNGNNCTINGTVSGCSNGLSNGTNHIINGTISGCSNGIYYGTNHIIRGTVSVCDVGVFAGSNHIISGTISGCNYVFRMNSEIHLFVIVKGAALIPIPPTFYNRITMPGDTHVVYCEDYAGVKDAHYSFQSVGDVLKNTSSLRPNGASSVIEVIPNSYCTRSYGEVYLFGWTELNVPATQQTKTIYVKGEGWTDFPTTDDLYFTAEYYNSTGSLSTTQSYFAGAISNNDDWFPISITFAPSQSGAVRYKGKLGKYQASSKIYIDNQLY